LASKTGARPYLRADLADKTPRLQAVAQADMIRVEHPLPNPQCLPIRGGARGHWRGVKGGCPVFGELADSVAARGSRISSPFSLKTANSNQSRASDPRDRTKWRCRGAAAAR